MRILADDEDGLAAAFGRPGLPQKEASPKLICMSHFKMTVPNLLLRGINGRPSLL